MNAARIEQHDLSYSDKPPILIGASSEAAMARAVRTIEAAGHRVGDMVMLDSALNRIEQQIAASAIWLELDRDGGAPMDEVLDYLCRNVTDGRFAAVVSSTAELIDPVSARIDDGTIELIVEADEAERAAALAMATTQMGMEQRLSDVASDQSAARLRQLSDEVSRIAATLARLSSGPGAVAPIIDSVPRADSPEISVETVRTVIRARRLRARYFSEELFADPAWDMLLDLLQAEIAHLRVPVSSLCIAAAVPATTALRWLKTMVSEGLFIRRADPHDGRRVFVELAPDTSQALRRYFAEVGSPAVI
ncbi:MAG TPA: MarR family winged helix-turn-helix transcriptional regulator [Sphingomicrobium sp.]|nr:MarR family winged helix-turn-helix transcriptional regulator [Sphingomicrobium sp.]